jgi:hypothetical protein
MEEHTEGIKTSIESIIGSDTILKRKKKSEDDINKESFEKIILTMEEVQVRSTLLHAEFKLDMFDYEEKFYEVIDRLLAMHFGKEASEIIFFYIYERLNPDGTMNQLADVDGNTIPLESPSDLWTLANYLKEKNSKVKKK